MQTALAQFETLRSLALNVTVLDPDGTIADTNSTWRDPCPVTGKTLPDAGRGLNYLDLCPPERARQLEHLLAGRCDLVTSVYPCEAREQPRWVLLIGLPLAEGRPRRAMLMHIDVSALLPFDLGHRELRALHSPETVGAPVLDAIVHTIEHTIARSMAGGPAGAAGPRPGGATNGHSLGLAIGAALGGQAGVGGALPGGLRRPDRPATEGARADGRELPHAETVTVATQLPKRQRQVFALLGDGKSNSEIAAALGISMNTAKLHVAAVLRRLGLDNRMQAVALAARVSRDTV